MYKFNRSDLPFDKRMKENLNKNGFLIIENFYTDLECNNLRNRADSLIRDFNPKNIKSVFDTKKQEHIDDSYFLESGDKIRFFFENKAFDADGNLTNKKELVINKIGHALHDLDNEFYKFSHREDLDQIAKFIDIKNPILIQSMYIFKQPNIGGEVACHQDSTFLYTEPDTVIGFWIALEDASIENGCLWVSEGGHKGPLRKLFTREGGKMKMITLNEIPFENNLTPVEVRKGTLVLLHGKLPHYSRENTSNKSRHAFTLHIIDGNAKYSKNNWLQRPNLKLNGFI
jgi:phytanoyl-CoA hydroxylase